MTGRFVIACAVASVPVLTVALTAAPGTECASLATLTIPNVTINASRPVAAGAFTAPGSQTAMTLPEFYRVEATVRPTSDSDIKFEVWIPPADKWNGKFQGVGNGGKLGLLTKFAVEACDGIDGLKDAPDKLIATHSTNGKVDRTRPLCPYPLVARYKGTGSTDEAASFSCLAELVAPPRKATTSAKP